MPKHQRPSAFSNALEMAAKRNYCVDTRCGCGGLIFASRILRALHLQGYDVAAVPLWRVSDQLRSVWLQDATQRAVTSELKKTTKTGFDIKAVEPTLRYLIHGAYHVLGLEEIEKILSHDCFAGEVLAAMKVHHAELQHIKLRNLERADADRSARARRLIEKHARHAERIKTKKQRDLDCVRTSSVSDPIGY